MRARHHLDGPDPDGPSPRDRDVQRACLWTPEGQELLLRSLATGADHAHLVWRALRPELIAALNTPDVHFLPSSQPEPYTPLPTPEHPPRPRPPLGQELHDLDEALRMAEGLNTPLNRRQLEVLEDMAKRVQRLHLRRLSSKHGTLDEKEGLPPRGPDFMRSNAPPGASGSPEWR